MQENSNKNTASIYILVVCAFFIALTLTVLGVVKCFELTKSKAKTKIGPTAHEKKPTVPKAESKVEILDIEQAKDAVAAKDENKNAETAEDRPNEIETARDLESARPMVIQEE